MTETEQRIAIAEADGWRHTTDGSDFWLHPDGRRVHGDNGRGTHLPDYPRDLNAMHATLMGQTAAFRVEFRACIFRMANEAGANVFEFGADKWAEAFILTLEIVKT